MEVVYNVQFIHSVIVLRRTQKSQWGFTGRSNMIISQPRSALIHTASVYMIPPKNAVLTLGNSHQISRRSTLTPLWSTCLRLILPIPPPTVACSKQSDSPYGQQIRWIVYTLQTKISVFPNWTYVSNKQKSPHFSLTPAPGNPPFYLLSLWIWNV